MEKIFKNFLNNREENNNFGPEFRSSYRKAERDAFVNGLKELPVASFGLTSFMHDLKKISDDGKFEGGEYDTFKKALLDKEKEKIESILDKKNLPKESEELTKLKDEHLLDDSECFMLKGVIGQQVVNITNGTAKANAQKKAEEETKKANKKLKKFTEKPKEKKKGKFGCLTILAIIGVFWMVGGIGSCALHKVFPTKRDKAAAARYQQLQLQKPEAKPLVPVDTIIGYDKMKDSLSSTLDGMDTADRNAMERALRHIMLAQAQKTATGDDLRRINAELREAPDVNKDAPTYAAEDFLKRFEKQGFSRIVENESDAKPGELVTTYQEVAEAVGELHDKRVKEVQLEQAKQAKFGGRN